MCLHSLTRTKLQQKMSLKTQLNRDCKKQRINWKVHPTQCMTLKILNNRQKLKLNNHLKVKSKDKVKIRMKVIKNWALKRSWKRQDRHLDQDLLIKPPINLLYFLSQMPTLIPKFHPTPRLPLVVLLLGRQLLGTGYPNLSRIWRLPEHWWTKIKR